MSYTEYFTGIMNAVIGKPPEAFEDLEEEEKQTEIIKFRVRTTAVVIFLVLFCYGAAKQAWCYGLTNEFGSFFTVFSSFFAFIGAPFYYPLYGIFLNPAECEGEFGNSNNNSGVVGKLVSGNHNGGRRRRS